jgi:hypothetical protein
MLVVFQDRVMKRGRQRARAGPFAHCAAGLQETSAGRSSGGSTRQPLWPMASLATAVAYKLSGIRRRLAIPQANASL